MKSWAWAAICISIASLGAMTSAAGCSSDDPAGDGDSDGEGGNGSGGDGSGATGNTSSTMSTASGMPTSSSTSGMPTSSSGSSGGCADEPTEDDCVNCFVAMFQAGADKFGLFLANACLCDPMGLACNADCAAECPFTDPMAMISEPCGMCYDTLMMGEPCIGVGQMDCNADADCAEFLNEVQACFQ